MPHSRSTRQSPAPAVRWCVRPRIAYPPLAPPRPPITTFAPRPSRPPLLQRTDARCQLSPCHEIINTQEKKRRRSAPSPCNAPVHKRTYAHPHFPLVTSHYPLVICHCHLLSFRIGGGVYSRHLPCAIREGDSLYSPGIWLARTSLPPYLRGTQLAYLLL